MDKVLIILIVVAIILFGMAIGSFFLGQYYGSQNGKSKAISEAIIFSEETVGDDNIYNIDYSKYSILDSFYMINNSETAFLNQNSDIFIDQGGHVALNNLYVNNPNNYSFICSNQMPFEEMSEEEMSEEETY